MMKIRKVAGQSHKPMFLLGLALSLSGLILLGLYFAPIPSSAYKSSNATGFRLPNMTVTNSSIANSTAITNSTNSTLSLISGNANQTNLTGVGQNPPGNITGTGRRH